MAAWLAQTAAVEAALDAPGVAGAVPYARVVVAAGDGPAAVVEVAGVRWPGAW